MAKLKNKNRRKQHEMYRSLGRRLINKRRKLRRHLRRYPGDVQAVNALKRVGG